MNIKRYINLKNSLYFIILIIIFSTKTDLWLSIVASFILSTTVIITSYLDRLNKRFFTIVKIIIAVTGLSISFGIVFYNIGFFEIVIFTISVLIIHITSRTKNKGKL